MVVFLFQMVFMDTALTIVTGTAAERWKFAAFMVSSFVLGAFIYPLFANWAWGGGWLATLGTNFGLGHGYADFAGLRRRALGGRRHGARDGHHHRPAHRQVHARRQAERDHRPRHRHRADSAASSSRSAGSGSTPVPRSARPATATCASARSRSTRCSPGWPAASARCSTCGCATASPTPRCPATACWPAWSPSRRRAAS